MANTEYKTRITEDKETLVGTLKETFKDMRGFVFTDYRGLTVEQITELRRKLRTREAEYHVVKNNFARLAFRQLEKPDVSPFLVGPTAVALVPNESGEVVKDLFDFAKEWSVQVKGGLIDGTLFDAAQVEAFSRLPSHDQLLAMLMGTMQAPLQNLVYAINGVTQKLVRTLAAIAEKKGAA